MPGALEFILEHHGRIPMHVASGTPHDELAAIFRERDLERYFGMILGTPPPKTELLARIVSETGADPSRVLMVGDSSTDLKARPGGGNSFLGKGRLFWRIGYPWGTDLRALDDPSETLFLPDRAREFESCKRFL